MVTVEKYDNIQTYLDSLPDNKRRTYKIFIEDMYTGCFSNEDNFTDYNFNDPNIIFLAFVPEHDQPVGMLQAMQKPPDKVFIYNVCVDKYYQKTGVGKALLNHVITNYTQQYYELRVDWNNLPVIKFYTKFIFCDWYLDPHRNLILYGYKNRTCNQSDTEPMFNDIQAMLTVKDMIEDPSNITDSYKLYETYKRILEPETYIHYIHLDQHDIAIIRHNPHGMDCAINALETIKELSSEYAGYIRQTPCNRNQGTWTSDILKLFNDKYPRYIWNFLYININQLNFLRAIVYIGLQPNNAIFVQIYYQNGVGNHVVLLWKDANGNIWVIDHQQTPYIIIPFDKYIYLQGHTPIGFGILYYQSKTPSPNTEIEMNDNIPRALFRQAEIPVTKVTKSGPSNRNNRNGRWGDNRPSYKDTRPNRKGKNPMQ